MTSAPKLARHHGSIRAADGSICVTTASLDQALRATRDFWSERPSPYHPDWSYLLAEYSQGTSSLPSCPPPSYQQFYHSTINSPDSAPGPLPLVCSNTGIEMDVAWGQTTLRFGLHRPSVTGPIFVYRVCTALRQDTPTRMQVLSHADLSPDQLLSAIAGQHPDLRDVLGLMEGGSCVPLMPPEGIQGIGV